MVVVIFSEPNDIHSLTVQSFIERELQRTAVILDAAAYPTAWKISMSVGDGVEYRLMLPDGAIALSEIEGVWRRRIRAHEIHPSIVEPEVRRHCYREAESLFKAFVDSLPNVMNGEIADLQAARKAYQLEQAVASGLRIPRTLISSDPEEVRAFYDALQGRVVFKLLSPTPFQLSETRHLEPDHLAFLDTTVFAPTIYQEMIVPKEHFRVTIVDEQVFAASLRTTREHALLDWRLDPDPVIRAAELPPDAEEGLLALMRRLGLRYGAADFIVNGDDQCFFLEVNPGGQYLFVEIQTAQPISLAIANALCRLT